MIIGPKTIKLGLNERAVILDALRHHAAAERKRKARLQSQDMIDAAEDRLAIIADLIKNDFFSDLMRVEF